MRTFTNIMLQGKVHSVMRYLSDNHGTGILELDETVDSSKTVRDILIKKHPASRDIDDQACVGEGEKPPKIHPVLFDQQTGESIRAAALRTEGSAGPSVRHRRSRLAPSLYQISQTLK